MIYRFITHFKLNFILGLLLAGLVLNAQAQQSPILSEPGYYRMQFGDYEVIALSDGTFSLNSSQLLTPPKPGEIKKLLDAAYLGTTVETSINAYLIKTPDKLILVDVGCGTAMGPTLGQVAKSLSNAGYKPEQIDAVLLTHLHADHVGGLMNGTQMEFPNAMIYISKAEAGFWLSKENEAKATARSKPFFKPAEASIAQYLKAGKVKTFDFGTTVFTDITAVSSLGHTPGSTMYTLESKGQKMIFWGDLVHASSVQFADPSITIQFDVDPAQAVASRKKVFAEAAKYHYWVAAPHISFPGIGQVQSTGNGSYNWLPANYCIVVPAQSPVK